MIKYKKAQVAEAAIAAVKAASGQTAAKKTQSGGDRR